MFEQGAGSMDLVGALAALRRSVATDGAAPAGSGALAQRVALHPSMVDATACPYFWPYCRQPLFHGSAPSVFNITISPAWIVHGNLNATSVVVKTG